MVSGHLGGREMGQALPQSLIRPEQQRLQRGDAAVERLGDLGVFQPLVFVHQHGCKLLRRQGVDGRANFPGTVRLNQQFVGAIPG